MEDQLRKSALDYHRFPTPGKIAVTPTKGLLNQRDLALAYTPGVAAACELIVSDPAEARNMTFKPNGIVTNLAFGGAGRHIEINFDGGFTSCSARVVRRANLSELNSGGNDQ